LDESTRRPYWAQGYWISKLFELDIFRWRTEKLALGLDQALRPEAHPPMNVFQRRSLIEENAVPAERI
jgi:hypothetical protein